jgi:hypothetical protein
MPCPSRATRFLRTRGRATICVASDPHGDLSRDLLSEIQSWRARDLVYIDPRDQERVAPRQPSHGRPAPTARFCSRPDRSRWCDSRCPTSQIRQLRCRGWSGHVVQDPLAIRGVFQQQWQTQERGVTSSIDFAEIMDERKILIANLSKGVLGPRARATARVHSRLWVVTRQWRVPRLTSGCGRAFPFFLLADEIRNFATDSFGEIASERG